MSLTRAAFDNEVEAVLARRLISEADSLVSLVAVSDDGELVGSAIYSPIKLDGAPDRMFMALGPISVAPDVQRSGIGGALIAAGNDACRKLGAAGVLLLGSPDYYPRFGFRPASVFGVESDYPGVGDAFMAIELTPGGLSDAQGGAHYHPAFPAG